MLKEFNVEDAVKPALSSFIETAFGNEKHGGTASLHIPDSLITNVKGIVH